MIHLTHPKWRALRVMDEASVKYLNRMFRQGWFVMPFGMDEVDYFVLRVPTETPTASTYPGISESIGGRWSHSIMFDVSRRTLPAMTVLVLNKGEMKSRQRAVLARRNGEGRVDMGEAVLPLETWRPVITTMIEEGLLTIYERGKKAE
jgi:hypothetical protein